VPQWGEPLPPYRHLVEPTGASAFGPGLPPSPARRSPGYTVSASEYLSGQEALRLARSQAPAVAAAGTPRGAAPRAERPLLLAGLADALGLSNVQDIPDGPSPAGPDTRVWTLADAAEQGLRHSPEVQAARARLAASREAAAPSSEPRWRADLRRLRTAFGAAPATDDGPAPAARDADRGEIAQATLQATVADVGADVAQRYLATLQARVVLSLAQEHERQLLHLVGLVQARGGTLADEAGQLDRQADQAREQVLQARAALEASMQALSARVGDTPQRMLMDVPQPWRAPADLQAAMDTARQHSRTQRTQADLQSVYAQLQSMNSRHGALRAELAAQRRALSSARARLLADGRSLGELVERYQAVHDRRVELATLMLGDAMGQVRVVQLTGQLPQAFAMADTRR
jgi:outer membrane protein TolC